MFINTTTTPLAHAVRAELGNYITEPRLSPVNALQLALRAEESDAYSDVIATLGPRWRVIACREGLQWILQRHQGKTPGAGGPSAARAKP